LNILINFAELNNENAFMTNEEMHFYYISRQNIIKIYNEKVYLFMFHFYMHLEILKVMTSRKNTFLIMNVKNYH